MKAYNALPQAVFHLPCNSPSFCNRWAHRLAPLFSPGSTKKTPCTLYRDFIGSCWTETFSHTIEKKNKTSCPCSLIMIASWEGILSPGFPPSCSAHCSSHAGPTMPRSHVKQLLRAPRPLGGPQAHALYAERMELLTSALSILGIIEHLTAQCGLQRVHSILSVRSHDG